MEEIARALNKTKYSGGIASLKKLSFHEYNYHELFSIEAENEKYIIKVRSNDSWNINDSINILQDVIDEIGFIEKHTDIIKDDKNLYLIRKYIDGNTLDKCSIDDKCNAFRMLARFNVNNIKGSNFTSMYVDGKKFDSIDELVDYEINFYLESYNGKHDKKCLKSTADSLKSGIGCIVIEDMNNGNALYTKNSGTIKIIDTDYILCGLNLYQFEHIDPFKFKTKGWYNIQDEAKQVLLAYYNEINIPPSIANSQLNAFLTLSLLREMYFLHFNNKSVSVEEYDNKLDFVAKSGLLVLP